MKGHELVRIHVHVYDYYELVRIGSICGYSVFDFKNVRGVVSAH